MKKNKNKIIIISIFLCTLIIYLILNFIINNKKPNITEQDAKNKIIQALGDNQIEKIENQTLVLTKNDNYMIMVVKDEYILTDFSKNPPKIFHFKSNKPDIKVKVIEIKEDGYLVEHDDHSHFIHEKLDENVKVGDFIYIKDPHTYLQDYHENEDHDNHDDHKDNN